MGQPGLALSNCLLADLKHRVDTLTHTWGHGTRPGNHTDPVTPWSVTSGHNPWWTMDPGSWVVKSVLSNLTSSCVVYTVQKCRQTTKNNQKSKNNQKRVFTVIEKRKAFFGDSASHTFWSAAPTPQTPRVSLGPRASTMGLMISLCCL